MGTCDGHVISRQTESDQSQQKLFTLKTLVICAVCTSTAFLPQLIFITAVSEEGSSFKLGTLAWLSYGRCRDDTSQIYLFFSEMLQCLENGTSLNCQTLN